MFPDEMVEDAEKLLQQLRGQNLRIATAESCTGGLISAVLTAVPGSSDVLECGFVTYSNESKSHILGVPPVLIGTHGAVSAEVARAMVLGALAAASRADIAIAVTGIAGPGGGSPEKPVGLVELATSRRDNNALVMETCRYGDIGRSEIRSATVRSAFALVRKIV
jgi:nicotinamide-nucleotide amidase